MTGTPVMELGCDDCGIRRAADDVQCPNPACPSHGRFTIKSFSGTCRFLSNFFTSPILYEGVTYPTVEHAFQAAKTNDLSQRQFVHDALSPGEAKRRGRRVDLRPDWEEVKVRVMLELLRLKFANPSLRSALIGTGDAILVEGNTWGDTFWGVCEGGGKNMLGKLLMLVRGQIRDEQPKRNPFDFADLSGAVGGLDPGDDLPF